MTVNFNWMWVLGRSASVAGLRRLDENMQAMAALRSLSIGVELLDDLLRPWLYNAIFDAIVQINENDAVIFSEHEAYSIVALKVLICGQGGFE